MPETITLPSGRMPPEGCTCEWTQTSEGDRKLSRPDFGHCPVHSIGGMGPRAARSRQVVQPGQVWTGDIAPALGRVIRVEQVTDDDQVLYEVLTPTPGTRGSGQRRMRRSSLLHHYQCKEREPDALAAQERGTEQKGTEGPERPGIPAEGLE